MKTISKSKLKAHMLKIFRDIEESGQDLVVTDHDVPVLRISPIRGRASVEHVFESHQGGLQFLEDPDMPTGDEWPET